MYSNTKAKHEQSYTWQRLMNKFFCFNANSEEKLTDIDTLQAPANYD